jgi:hypothetical protein
MILVFGGILAAMALLVVLEIWSVSRTTRDLENRIRSIRGDSDGEEE